MTMAFKRLSHHRFIITVVQIIEVISGAVQPYSKTHYYNNDSM